MKRKIELRGSEAAIEQALAELRSNIQYDQLPVEVEEAGAWFEVGDRVLWTPEDSAELPRPARVVVEDDGEGNVTIECDELPGCLVEVWYDELQEDPKGESR